MSVPVIAIEWITDMRVIGALGKAKCVFLARNNSSGMATAIYFF